MNQLGLTDYLMTKIIPEMQLQYVMMIDNVVNISVPIKLDLRFNFQHHSYSFINLG